MSADNWAMCPRCKANRRRRAEKARRKADDAYGKVDRVEFDLLDRDAQRESALADSERETFRTFREDYEISGAADGEVVVSYSGRCAECGLSLAFEHRHRLDADATE